MEKTARGYGWAGAGLLALAIFSAATCDDDDGDDIDVVRVDGGAFSGGGGSVAGGSGGSVAGGGGSVGSGGSGGATGIDAGVAIAALTSEAQALAVMVQLNVGEIRTATVARTRAASQPVIEFANEMLTEHGAAEARLAGLIVSTGILPATSQLLDVLRDATDRTVAALRAIQDDATLESAYVRSQVSAHELALQLIDQQLAPLVQNPDLRNELTTMRTEMSNHLTQARALQNTDAGVPSDAAPVDVAAPVVPYP